MWNRPWFKICVPELKLILDSTLWNFHVLVDTDIVKPPLGVGNKWGDLWPRALMGDTTHNGQSPKICNFSKRIYAFSRWLGLLLMVMRTRINLEYTGSPSKKSKTPTFLIDNKNVREGSGHQIGWIFGKIPNGLRPPLLIFGKLYCNFFMTDMFLLIFMNAWSIICRLTLTAMSTKLGKHSKKLFFC